MTVFSPEDVQDISAGGNVAFNQKYMARYTSRDTAYASTNDAAKLKEFIHLKYVQVSQ